MGAQQLISRPTNKQDRSDIATEFAQLNTRISACHAHIYQRNYCIKQLLEELQKERLHAVDLDDKPGRDSALRARIAELEAQVKDYELQQRIREAKDRVRKTVGDMTSEDDWRHVVTDIYQELKDLIGVECLGISLFDSVDADSYKHYVVIFGSEVKEFHEVKMTAPALRQAFDSGMPVYRRNKREITRIDGAGLAEQVGSVLEVPFAGGAIGMSARQENAFSDSDIDTATQFCSVIEEGYRRLGDIRQIRQQDAQLYRAQQMDSVGLIAAGIAHNFNNLLQVIMGNIYMAKLDVASEQQLALIEEAESAGQRASEIVRQLRLSVHPNLLNKVHSINPSENIQNIVELARSTFEQTIEVELHFEGDIPLINMDSSFFEQVVLNVLLNARDAVIKSANDYGRTPRIDIRMSTGSSPVEATDANYLRIDIIDNGCGMDSATQQRIYDPFFTTKGPSATGLGLSTVQKILEDQGGHMLCESSLGERTHFSIYMPLGFDREVEEDNNLTVLVADGEEIVRNSTRSILEHHGYNTLIAGSGQEAIEAFRLHRPDLLLLDLSISDGPESAPFTTIQHMDPAANILVFVGEEDALSPEILDADPLVIRKPYLASELLAMVRQATDA